MRTIQYSELTMLQGARIQFRSYFRTMALGGRWSVYRAEPGETLSGVVLAPLCDIPPGALVLVGDVQGMAEETMVIKLSQAIRQHGATADFFGA